MTDSESECLFGQEEEESGEERNPTKAMDDAKTSIVDDILEGRLDGAEIFTCEAFAPSAKTRNGVTADKLSKIWKISLKDANRTLDVTSQHCNRSENPAMSRQCSTNNRMLRCKRINE